MTSAIPRIQVGQKLPQTVIKMMGKEGPTSVKVADLFTGKRGVLFALPGAFTPTCSSRHLPGFVELADKLREKNKFDVIACLSVNDAFVMDAWGAQQKADTANIMMLADGNGDFSLRGCPALLKKCNKKNIGCCKILLLLEWGNDLFVTP